MKNPEFIHIDGCNFEDYPPGGTLSFSIQMRKAFGNSMAIAGIVTDETPCGKWIEKEIDGVIYNFFGIERIQKQTSKPLIPIRLSSYLSLKKHMSNLGKLGLRKIFTRTPQFMLALKRSEWESICFCFAGTANSVAISRYPFLRWMGGFYERQLFRSLANNADCILAAADDQAIESTIARSKNLLSSGSIKKFPTRFDNNIFFPQTRDECRSILSLPNDRTIIAVNGRLCWVKGWKFVVDAFRQYLLRDPNALLLFIGDGEDRQKLQLEHNDLIQDDSVRVTGRIRPTEVSTYLGAADLVMVGSHEEGWSNAMIEALACGKPIVSTNISGAQDMVLPDKNGYILFDRDPEKAAHAMEAALNLTNAGETSQLLSRQYSMATLRQDLKTLWLGH